MTDHDRDRGAYTPSGDGPLAFDARNASGRGVGRPPTTLIISALILFVVCAVMFVMYFRSGVRQPGEPPVVGQPVGDVRQAPPASAQPAGDAAAGLQVYSAEQASPASSAPPTFAAAPETPLPRPAAAAPLPTAPPAHAASSAAVAPSPAIPATPPKPAAAPAIGGGAMVQIGAFSSPVLADKGWNDVARLIPGSMAGRTKRVEPVSKDPATLYRAYVGGFDSKADAVSFCADLKAAGHACIVK